jgi:uncharacterized membrane protein YfcA
MAMLLVCLGTGLGVGFLSGLLGIGGGLVLVPAFAMLFSLQGVEPSVVMPLTMGTSIATIIFTSLSSVRAHHGRGCVDWIIVRRMAPGIAFGAACGGLLSAKLPATALSAAFALFAAIAATQLLVCRETRIVRALPRLPGLFATSGGMGIVSGLVGVGAATLAVPFLTRCSVSVRTAIGCASALAVPVAIAGAAAYVSSGLGRPDLPPFTIGFVHLPAAAAVVTTSMLAAPLGAAASHRLPTATLRKLFAVLMYVVAVRMLSGLF